MNFTDSKFKTIFTYFILFLLGFIAATNYVIFVFPNKFAPSGINGIATMIQYIFNFKVGYMSLIINIPLFIATFLLGYKDFALKNLIYVISFSVWIILLEKGGILDISSFAYGQSIEEVNGVKYVHDASIILGPLAAGVINGFVYGISIRNNSATGGTDFVAKIIHRFKPQFSLIWIIFILNASVAVASYFVYGLKFEPVICCFIYTFVTTIVSDRMLKGTKSAIKFEVVTDKPEELADEIIKKLRHDATVVKAVGMFTHNDKSLLICVINKRQSIDFQHILRKYPGSFAYMTGVNETWGNFIQAKSLVKREEVEESKIFEKA